jgi:PAS domain S-box-containing protein
MTSRHGTGPDNDHHQHLAALEAQVERLEAALAAAGLRTRAARFATTVADDATRQARADATAAAAGHTRDMAAGRAELAGSAAMNAQLLDLNAALRASEERLEAVVESATDSAIIEMDFDGRITGWSPGAERLLGWTAAEAIGQDGAMIWTPEDRAADQAAGERRVADETGSVAADRWHLKRDGTRFWGSGHLTPLRNGRPRGYLKVLRDRTPERRAEEAIRASEARCRALATAGTSMVYRMSADWRLMIQLDGRNILADTPEPIEGWAERYILPADRPSVWAAIEDAIRTRSLFTLEHRVRLADGSVGWVFSRAVPILGPDGEIVEWFGAGTDVTARREAEDRQAFLLRLADALRPLADPVEVQRTATRLLADHLGVVRAAYFEMEPDEDRFAQATGHEDDAVRLPARMRMSDYGPDIVASYRSGRPVAAADIEADPRFRAHRDAYRAIGVRAWAGVPLVKDGRLAVILGVHSPVARRWTTSELQLLEEVAQRSWAAVELARLRRRTADLDAFLLRFSEAVRGRADPQAVAATACRLVAEELGAERAYWAEVDWATRDYVIGAAFHRPGVPVVAGRFALDDWEPFTSLQLAGRPSVVDDTQADARVPPAMREGFARIAVGADLAAPVIADGRLRCVLAVNQRQPRRWTPEEVALVQAIAGRCWVEVERARAEAATRESEARYRALFESMDEAYAVVEVLRDADGAWNDFRFLQANPAFVAHTSMPYPVGRTASELLGTPNPRWTQLYGQALDTGLPLRVQEAEPTLGRVFDLNIFSLDRARNRVAVLFTDITQRVHAEAALRESEARFRGFAENSADVLWITTGDGSRLEYLSPAFERTFGEAPDRVMADIGRLLDLVHPDDRADMARFLPRAVAGETVIAQYRVIRPADGHLVYLRATGFPIRDAEGAVVRIAGIVQDVSDLQAAAEAREAETERFRTLAEGLPELVWRAAAQGRWRWSSPQWQDFTGLDDAGSRDDGWLAAVHPADRARAAAAWAEAEAMGLYQADFRLRHGQSGQYAWFQTRALPVRNAEGNVLEWIGACSNIDDQVRARETLARGAEELERRVQERTAELMAAEESLRQSQKMEAIGQLTGGIAHDFNNMLQGVVGGLDMAQRRQDEGRGGDAGRYMVAARDAAERAAGLTRRLLAFARKQRLEPKTVDANALISGMADLVRRTVGPAIEVELGLCDGRWPVLCDASELEGAVLNLCINGRDAMPDGGRLTIATEEMFLSADQLQPGDEASPGEYVAVRVIDTGTGMTPEVLAHVLEPFFTTKPQGQGTGLGLSQVYGFTRQSGGVLRIESAPGRGTAVHILLPRGRPELVRAAETDRTAGGKSASVAGGTVLMVDDELAVRVPAGERLRDLGYRVVEAPDGPSALRMLEEGLRPDLLVSDVGLPNGLDGRALAEAARQKLPGLPVLFMTGYARVALPDDAAVITKPFDLQALAERVMQALSEFPHLERD